MWLKLTRVLPFAFYLLLLFGLSCEPTSPPQGVPGPTQPITDSVQAPISQPVIAEPDKYAETRARMVQTQLAEPPDGRTRITDPKVLEVMRKVPRHKFVLPHLINSAYEDGPLPIGYGQTISQPYMVAMMTQCLELRNDAKVLEIGTGSGYQAAILAEMVKEVYTIEIVEALSERATKTLQTLGYKNIKTRCVDGYFGWEEYAPFDGIIITAAATHIPPPLLKQLKDGGIMVLPLGSTFSFSNLTVVKKTGADITTRYVMGCLFVPMTGEMSRKK
jgi:protein-L-isoaspartate(D-aspartate) O-methyltransferase